MSFMNRLHSVHAERPLERSLRIGAVLMLFAAMNQLKEPLVGASMGQELAYNIARFLVLAIGLVAADRLIAALRYPASMSYPWLGPVVLGTLIAALPFSAVDMWLEQQFPVRAEYVDEYRGSVEAIIAFLGEYATTVSLLLPAHFLVWIVLHTRGWPEAQPSTAPITDTPEETKPDTHEALPDFLQRAGIEAISEVMALEADEHYVRVHHAGGSSMVLHRFGSAIECLPETAGLRVHRSWWVADAAVASASRGGRRWQLSLTTGHKVNISDTYLDAVRQRGWLKKRA